MILLIFSQGLKPFSEKDVLPILNNLKKQNDNIIFGNMGFELPYEYSKRSLMMTPNERKFWIDELIKQREKEAERN